jgi:hypothetical protein
VSCLNSVKSWIRDESLDSKRCEIVRQSGRVGDGEITVPTRNRTLFGIRPFLSDISSGSVTGTMRVIETSRFRGSKHAPSKVRFGHVTGMGYTRNICQGSVKNSG